MSTTRIQFTVNALQCAIENYQVAIRIASTIGFDLYIARHHMYWGLCHYFSKNYGAIVEIIMSELNKDLNADLERYGDFAFLSACDLNDNNDVKNLALAPRLEWMQKTLLRLQKELNAA